MKRRFTDDLPERSGCDPPPLLLDQVSAALNSILTRKRLWAAPPARLGYHEFASWTDAGAMRTLTFDGYIYAVLTRWNALQASREDGGDINPLIYLNLQLFVDERWRRENPIAAAVFANVRLGIGLALRQDICRRRGGQDSSAPIGAGDEILFAGQPDAAPADQGSLRHALGAVFDYNALVLEVAVRNAAVQRELATRLSDLPTHGVLCFVVRAMVKILQDDARRWGVGCHASIDDPETIGDLLLPGERPNTRDLEWREMREALDRLRERVVGSKHQERTKEVMLRMLKVYMRAVENGEEPPGPAPIARLLGLPPVTVWDARNRLKELGDGLF